MPPLVFYVFLDDLDGGATCSEEAVGPCPEYWFPIVLPQVLSELLPSQTTRHRFEIIDEDAHLHAGMTR